MGVLKNVQNSRQKEEEVTLKLPNSLKRGSARNAIPQMLRWNKKPELEKLHVHWHTVPHSHKLLAKGKCIPISSMKSVQIADDENAEKVWVGMEQDPLYVKSVEFLLAHIQSRDREIQDIPLVRDCLRPLQERNQELLSSMEVVDEVDCSMAPAAIVEDHVDEDCNAQSAEESAHYEFLRSLELSLSRKAEKEDAEKATEDREFDKIREGARQQVTHIQNRDRATQGLKSSEEVMEEVDCSMVSAAIVEDHVDEDCKRRRQENEIEAEREKAALVIQRKVRSKRSRGPEDHVDEDCTMDVLAFLEKLEDNELAMLGQEDFNPHENLQGLIVSL